MGRLDAPHAEAGHSAEMIIPDFQAFVKAGLLQAGVQEADLARYEAANPAFMPLLD